MSTPRPPCETWQWGDGQRYTVTTQRSGNRPSLRSIADRTIPRLDTREIPMLSRRDVLRLIPTSSIAAQYGQDTPVAHEAQFYFLRDLQKALGPQPYRFVHNPNTKAGRQSPRRLPARILDGPLCAFRRRRHRGSLDRTAFAPAQSVLRTGDRIYTPRSCCIEPPSEGKVVTQFALCPVGWYNRRMEFLGRTGGHR